MQKTKEKRRISAVMIIFAMLLQVFFLPLNNNITSKAVDYNFCFPVKNGCKIAFIYGYSASYGGTHSGIDIHASGDDTIYAAYDGVVKATANSCPHIDWAKTHGKTDCGHLNTFGNYIRIEGTNGLQFYYGHLKQNSLKVKVGDKITKGQAIATMGSSGCSTGKHLHFEVRTSTASSAKINVNPASQGGLITYANGPYSGDFIPVLPTSGTFYLKNKGTGTYMYVTGADSNGMNVGLGEKKDDSHYKMKITAVKSGDATSGCYITPESGSKVINPYSDTPANGTNITVYTKNTDGTQYWVFEQVSGGYILHNYYNSNLVLNGTGSNVNIATKTGTDSQIWVIEEINPDGGFSPVLPALGTFYLKNKGTGTYMYVTGADSNGMNVGLGEKKDDSHYKMKITAVKSGDATSGCYITPESGSKVINPYSDTPANGTNVTVYTKNTDGTQYWVFEQASGGYILHNYYNSNLVLNGTGSNVNIATRTGADSQIWIVEEINPVIVTTPEPVTTTTTTTVTTTTTTVTTTEITTEANPIFTVDEKDITLKPNEQYTIKASKSNLTYKSGDTNIAVVSSSGVITAFTSGKTVISVIDDEYNVVQINLTVSDKLLKGDTNLDGRVSISDAVAILQYMANSSKYKLAGESLDNADVDGTPGISGKDAAIIQLYDAGLITEF